MKPFILIVEDNEDLLFNLKLTLEFNGYDVATATNGVQALTILQETDRIPDLIISDIMMPEMDGYEFFKIISENPIWNTIPFVFLTALVSPEDIKIGKMLGVDDYLVKPFKEDDLLATIQGKIARRLKSKSLTQNLSNLLHSLNIKVTPSMKMDDRELSAIFFIVKWDDKLGPLLQDYYPRRKLPYSIETIGFQLFNSATAIYGQDKIYEANGLLLNIENIDQMGYVFFEAIPDQESRGKQRPFMLGLITPTINYFESLKIREVMGELAIKIKEGRPWNIQNYWEKVVEILRSPLL
ncbi:MAG: response regulator [Candidatus Helarchaeota archaeon]